MFAKGELFASLRFEKISERPGELSNFNFFVNFLRKVSYCANVFSLPSDELKL